MVHEKHKGLHLSKNKKQHQYIFKGFSGA